MFVLADAVLGKPSKDFIIIIDDPFIHFDSKTRWDGIYSQGSIARSNTVLFFAAHNSCYVKMPTGYKMRPRTECNKNHVARAHMICDRIWKNPPYRYSLKALLCTRNRSPYATSARKSPVSGACRFNETCERMSTRTARL